MVRRLRSLTALRRRVARQLAAFAPTVWQSVGATPHPQFLSEQLADAAHALIAQNQ